MTEEAEAIEVNLDTPKEAAKEASKDEPVVEIAEEAPSKSEKKESSSDEDLLQATNNLKRQLEYEQMARAEAERRAQEAAYYAQQAKSETIDAQYQMVQNAIDTLKNRSESLKSALSEAHSVGDYDKVAQLQEAISINTNQMSDLKRGEKAMKEQMAIAEKTRNQPQPQYQQPQGEIADQVIASVAQTSPRSAVWIQENRAHINSEKDVRRMIRAHEDAIDEGIQVESPDYFQFIENRMGISRAREQKNDDSASDGPLSAAAAPKKASPPPPAPVSRGGQRSNVVRLSAAEADTAKSLGMTPEEYAKNKQALIKEGRYGH